MKIDFYISSLSGGGAEKVLTTLAENFAAMGNDVGIFSLEKRPQFYTVSDSVSLEKVNNMKKGSLSETLLDFSAIKRRLKHRNSDISISFLSRCNIMLVLASLFTKRKVIVCDRNNPLMEHSKFIFNLSCRVYSHATAIFVQTEKIKSFYPAYLQDKIYVLENPLDFNALQEQISDVDICPENAIVSIGRLEQQKDFSTLIRAFSAISSDYPDWHLDLFGKGDMKDELVALSKELGVGDRVNFRGLTDKPFLELKRSKLFVLSSNYEGFPNALCEAMASGLACISSDCVSGPSELIVNGENGYLFQVGDDKALAELMSELISSPEKREQFGSNAHSTVQRLELSVIVNKWFDTIKSIGSNL